MNVDKRALLRFGRIYPMPAFRKARMRPEKHPVRIDGREIHTSVRPSRAEYVMPICRMYGVTPLEILNPRHVLKQKRPLSTTLRLAVLRIARPTSQPFVRVHVRRGMLALDTKCPKYRGLRRLGIPKHVLPRRYQRRVHRGRSFPKNQYLLTNGNIDPLLARLRTRRHFRGRGGDGDIPGPNPLPSLGFVIQPLVDKLFLSRQRDDLTVRGALLERANGRSLNLIPFGIPVFDPRKGQGTLRIDLYTVERRTPIRFDLGGRNQTKILRNGKTPTQ